MLSDEDSVGLIKEALDGNSDGFLSFSEVLGADILSIARDVKIGIFGGDGGGSIGDDAILVAVTEDFLSALASNLVLGIANEAPPPPLALGELTGDALGFAEQAIRAATPPGTVIRVR